MVLVGGRFYPNSDLPKYSTVKPCRSISSNWDGLFHFTATLSRRGKSPRCDNKAVWITGLNQICFMFILLHGIHHIYTIKKTITFKVWLCLLGTVSIFVLSSSIIIKNKMDIVDSNANHQSLRITIYHQLDYVIRLFTNQGT